MGILGAPFDEAMGGLGGGAIETMIVMEEIGKALVIEPYLDTVVIGGGLLRRCGTPRASELIGGIIAGDVRLAFAHLEPSSRFDLANVTTSAVQEGGTWRISGLKDAVRGAPFATHVLVNARVSGAVAIVPECRRSSSRRARRACRRVSTRRSMARAPRT